MVANTYLEGTYSEFYPQHSAESEEACSGCSNNFPFPAESPAMSRPKRPAPSMKAASWAIRIAHAYGAVFDNPDLLVCCVVGDGEAETGALAASWHSNKFLNPGARWRGTSDPAPERLQDRQSHRSGRMTDDELAQLFTGYGYEPYFVEGHEPDAMHQLMAATLDTVIARDPVPSSRRPACRGEANARCGR